MRKQERRLAAQPPALPDHTQFANGGGWMLVPGQGAQFVPQTIPFAFPSLAHLDERVERLHMTMREVEGLQPGTLAWTRTAYASFRQYLVEQHLERRFLSGQLDSQLRVLEGWIAYLRVGGRSANGRTRVTINNYWRALALLCTRLHRQDGILNPLAFIATPKFGRTNPRYLSREMATRLLAAVDHYPWATRFERARNLALVGMLLLAGLRRGEALKLRYGEVDAEAGTIRIVRGKGRHGGKDRTCYMPAQLRKIIAAYEEQRRSKGCTTPAYFASSRGDCPIHTGAVRHIFGQLSQAIGSTVTPHMLRHTYATLLRQSGVADRVAMELLGHGSLDMLQRYSHVLDGETAAAAEALVLDVENERSTEAVHRQVG